MITTFVVLLIAVAAVWYFVEKNKKTLDVNKDGKLDANDVKLAVEEVKADVKKVEEAVVADVKKVEEAVKKVASKAKAAAPKAAKAPKAKK
jgi:hypothetical protein